MEDQDRKLIEAVKAEIAAAKRKPFKIAILGQTGYGKSSLLNALFETNLVTDPVRPCTKKIQRIEVTNNDGDKLWFYDLPGLGESTGTDAKYMELYVDTIKDADVVLWLFHADNRSLGFDLQALTSLYARLQAESLSGFISKITFVLSKADLVAPTPWICAREGDQCLFVPQEQTRQLLQAKSSYVEESFIGPLGDQLTASTFNDGGFEIDDGRFVYDEDQIVFHGYLDRNTVENLKTYYPRFCNIFDRLSDNHRVIPFSSYYRYNLYQLLNVIINKLGLEAIARFENFFRSRRLDLLDLSKAVGFRNFILMDMKAQKVIFDVASCDFGVRS